MNTNEVLIDSAQAAQAPHVSQAPTKRLVFFRGQIINIQGVHFKVAKVNGDFMLLRPVETGIQIKRK